MAYYPARYHFADLVLAVLLGFCIGALLFASPKARIEWENPNVVVAEVRE
jgi:hypothetical protein